MKRIAIVGGGMSGLLTAYFLERKTPDSNRVTLFEASERIGGKIITRQFDTAPVTYEAGVAELYDYSALGPDPLRRLVGELGLDTIAMSGETVVLGNRIMRNRADIRRHFGKKTLRAIEDFRRRGSALLSPDDYYGAGWPADNKHAWARRSFRSVLADIPDETARRYLKVAVHSDLATEPHLTNGLYGLENCLMDDPRYIQLYAIAGGLERLPRAVAGRITARVEVNRPVVRVEKARPGGYRVFFRSGQTTEYDDFDLVVVALPNYWLPRIEWGGHRLDHAMNAHHVYYDRPAHYLRITVLFQRPFWRELIADSYFQLDAFGGCCVYDEGARSDTGAYGVLSWLLGGSDALVMSNFTDRALIAKALETLPQALAAGRDSFLEGHVHRWVGTVSAQPGGVPLKGVRRRHRPEPKDHPGLFVVGDYLFDSTINGALDSADIVTDLVRDDERSAARADPAYRRSRNLGKAYFKWYDGKRSYQESFRNLFDAKYLAKQIELVWGVRPPYRLLDAGSANGMTLLALSKLDIDAWGIENSPYIHGKTSRKVQARNILGDVRALPFGDASFDFVYDTALCYLPESDVGGAIREFHRVARRGVVFGTVVSDYRPHVAERYQIYSGVRTLASLREWSERFLANGFRLAVEGAEVLSRLWRVERRANGDEMWLPTRESLRFCFYTKQG